MCATLRWARSISKTLFPSPYVNAAVIKSEMMKKIRDFGLIDAILVASQKELKCKIITADQHFTGHRRV